MQVERFLYYLERFREAQLITQASPKHSGCRMTTDHPSRLSGLPVELLTEILRFLPWKDVLHLRKTCRILSEVTRAREIWVNLVQESILSKEIPPHLERPIKSHSSIELERLFLLWKSADIGWKKDDGHPARERSFNCKPAEFAHLVEGGRWYLVTTETGEVTYYDLEAETITGVQLIPEQYRHGYFHVALEIDKDSPVLKFNMAFSSKYGSPLIIPETSRRYHAVHVWNVSSVLNESGHVAGLFATRIAAFPHRPRLSLIYRISLRGSHIAFTCSDNQLSKDHAVVVEWDRVDGNPRYPLRTVLTDGLYESTKIVLLPENCLLILRMNSFSLFNYSTITESTEILGNNQDIHNTFLWAHHFDGISVQPTIGVFCTENMTKLVAADSDCLFGFAISRLPNEPPSVSEILRFPRMVTKPIYTMGRTRGIYYRQSDKACMLIAYTLPDRGKPSSSFLYKHLSPDMPQIFDLVAMDEETGRIVLSYKGIQRAHVIDFALITGS